MVLGLLFLEICFLFYNYYLFKSVGGETLDVAIYHMKMFGRIIVCG
jgi:hypothetical protein